ncbi:MAG: cadherin-like beta sandwich domain-containing protein [Bacilli bacterium]|nr:cadherin-like beta sandwich domain-containing protein [Bacilli bacterium]
MDNNIINNDINNNSLNNNLKKEKKNKAYIIGLMVFIIGFIVINGSMLFGVNLSKLFGDVSNTIDALSIVCDDTTLEIGETANCTLKVNTGSYRINAIQGLLSSNTNVEISEVTKGSSWSYGDSGSLDIGYISDTDISGTIDVATFKVTAISSGTGTVTMGRNNLGFLLMSTDTFEDVNLTPKSINITVAEAEPEKSNNANLSSLTVNGTSVPNFHKDTLNYSVTLDSTAITATINATAEDTNAVGIEGKGTKNVTFGTQTFEITVTAEDGTTKKHYFVSIIVPVPASSDNTLKSLTVSTGTLTPDFDPGTTLYNVTIPYDVDNITITAVPNDDEADVDGDGVITIAEGETKTVNIKVTAEDQSDLTYSVTVTRESRPKSTNANLSSISVGTTDGTMDRTFNKDVTSYTITYNDDTTTSSVISVALEDSAATIATEGFTSWNSSTKSGNIAVRDNSYTAKIIVTAEDGTTKKTYNLLIKRRDRHTDRTLSSLSVSAGTLQPSFDSNVTSYSVTVPNNVSSITISARANDEYGRTSGTGTKSLTVGLNTFIVTGIAENGNELPYTISVTRQDTTPDDPDEPDEPDVPKSNNAYLSSLTVENETLSPAFNKEIFEYSVTTDADSITIGATREDDTARVDGTGTKSTSTLTHKVTVTAEDGVTKNIYTIKIIKSTTPDEEETVCKLDSSVYRVDNKDYIIYDVDSNHSDEVIKSNLKSSCGTITVEKDNVILKNNDKTITYTIVRVVVPKTGNEVIKYSLIIGILLTITGIAMMISAKQKKEA